ncbi:hypothetical protein [Dyadobacter sp. LHD-138]|uniref:hypothetical protein n=1 Tax=Dyadobacter sp. LHD-138 TaxID=3071413 RepID=UPI0027E02280|nr:hypothetical protein [Dyadobacter sp. LHD-138]MDQ6477830.1 hypothetical protein [Dyadobacter sp. LHD-138]
METQMLITSPANALKAYNNADPSIKKWMKDFYPEFNFDPNITDIVISYEAACEVVEFKPLTIENFGFYPEEDRESKFASHQIDIVAKALNGKDENGNWWKPDYSDGTPKYFPRHYWDEGAAGGPGFSFDGYIYAYSISNVGARHSFRKREHAVFAGQHFVSTYNKFLSPSV